MKGEKIAMNKIRLSGIVDSFGNSFCSYGEEFIRVVISSRRKSGILDRVNCVIPQCMFKKKIAIGEPICVTGEIHSRNVEEDNHKRRVDIFVFANEILDYPGNDINEVEGIFCIVNKKELRETPNGRQITDLVLAAHRFSGKSDYIPTIAWGRNAIRAAAMPIGIEINAVGRLQSREYIKRYEDGSEETKVAYELSVSRVEEIDKTEE